MISPPNTSEIGGLMFLGGTAVLGDPGDAARQTLHQLMPPGPALPRDPGTELDNVLTGASRELTRAEGMAWLSWTEGDPRTAAYMLEEWERLCGLPGCGQASTDVQDRRGAIVARLAAQGGGSRAFFIAIAAAMGYAITITEGHAEAARAGRARAGRARASGLGSLYRWTITTASGSNDSQLQCVIDDLRPAHTTIHWVFT